MRQTNTIDIIKNMSKNELLVSVLYRIYADTFPEHRDFWLNISNEEVEHSKWLEKLLSEVE